MSVLGTVIQRILQRLVNESNRAGRTTAPAQLTTDQRRLNGTVREIPLLLREQLKFVAAENPRNKTIKTSKQ